MKLLEPNLKLKTLIENRENQFPVENIISNLQEKIKILESKIEAIRLPKKLKIPTKDTVYFINFNDILYLKSESNYTYLFLANGKKIFISKTLKILVEKINDPAFIRIHASYFINSKYLNQYIKSKEKIIMENNKELPVSRTNKKLLTKWLEK